MEIDIAVFYQGQVADEKRGSLRIRGKTRDTAGMDLGYALPLFLCALGLIFQVAAIAVRKLFLSLFFSFVYALFIAILLLALHKESLAITCLWLVSGVSYSALIMTSLLLGSHNHQKPERQLSLSFFAYLGLLVFLAITLSGFFGEVELEPTGIVGDGNAVVYLFLALIALLCFIGSLLLVRWDDVS